MAIVCLWIYCWTELLELYVPPAGMLFKEQTTLQEKFRYPKKSPNTLHKLSQQSGQSLDGVELNTDNNS